MKFKIEDQEKGDSLHYA